MDQSENMILDEIRRGDSRKYALLVDQYKDRGLSLAVRIVRNSQEAEEILQDAFVKAYRRLGTFRGESSFGTWFYRILYNLCLTHVRRAKRPADSSEEFDAEDLESRGSSDAGGEAFLALEEREVKELLHAEVGRLPDPYRVSITLFYLQELSYEEIASVMRLPIGTVKTNLHRARLRLRKQVLAFLAEEDIVR